MKINRNQLADMLDPGQMEALLLRHSVGLRDALMRDMHVTQNSNFPPYNILATPPAEGESERYEITMAVAGYSKDDLSITIDDSVLSVVGTRPDAGLGAAVSYVHQGIAFRNFTQSFRLGDKVEVRATELRDGLLRITLSKLSPMEKKAKVILIGA